MAWPGAVTNFERSVYVNGNVRGNAATSVNVNANVNVSSSRSSNGNNTTLLF